MRIATGALIALVGVGVFLAGLWAAGFSAWYIDQPAQGGASYALHAVAFGSMCICGVGGLLAGLALVVGGVGWAFDE